MFFYLIFSDLGAWEATVTSVLGNASKNKVVLADQV